MKRAIQRIRRWLASAAALVLVSLMAAAAEGRLTVSYPYDGVSFSLYLVGVPAEGGYAPSPAFSGCRVVLPDGGSGAGVWRDAAITLAGYAAGMSPGAVQRTEHGWAVFHGLSAGLYLVTGQAHRGEGGTCLPAPVLIAVAEGAEISAEVKHDWESGGEDGGETELACSVRKIWRGDDAAARPERVTVQLLRDETVYDTATLSPDNGWSRTWRNLERGHRWQVVEPEVPEGYTVSVSRTGLDFTVCNTGTAEVPEEPGEVPETPVPSGKLPQTGQAWWPAAGLACMGAVLLAISAALRRRE